MAPERKERIRNTVQKLSWKQEKGKSTPAQRDGRKPERETSATAKRDNNEAGAETRNPNFFF
jgi:hypothetical protein